MPGGGLTDLLRTPPFYPVLIQLGYPPYLATILGTAKLIAGVILVAPALPRLKEWAYAGILINMIGAIASHLATHDSPTATIAPASFAILALLSWRWRPPSRRLDPRPRTAGPPPRPRPRTAGFRVELPAPTSDRRPSPHRPGTESQP